MKAIDQYEFGLDLGLSSDPARSFEIYQQRIREEFESLVARYDLIVLDGERKVEAIHRSVRDMVKELMRQ
jgi:dTMP kinase